MKDENKYDHSLIEKKWQKYWEESRTFSPDLGNAKNPYYNLMMFPYPSAEGLHVGNVYAFTGADVYARFNRMQGKDVFEPIGLDGFGIHSENYALKVGRHPMEQVQISEKNFYRQLHSIGNSFDWQRTVETYDPEYYKWTQWLFIQMFKAGLAYRAKATVNWCPSCKTVLSDEQVIDDKCERCSSTVEKKELEQWFFRITKYAQKLLDNLETLDWTEKVKIAQRNWIGRSEGAEIEFRIQNSEFRIEVFTTRADTLYGATFLVLAPEHELVSVILNSFQNLGIPKQVRDDVSNYVEMAKNETDKERIEQEKEKTGVFTGLYAINPVNGEKLPIWIADFVLGGYGTGAVFADAHDERDFEFAKRFGIPLKPTLKTGDEEMDRRIANLEECFSGEGILFDSGEFNGLTSKEAKKKIVEKLEKDGQAKFEVNYHLRDWLISRQRYWGPPIPMVYCENCANKGKSWFTTKEAGSKYQEARKGAHNTGYRIHDSMKGWFPVPEKDLPVRLPKIDDYKPLGTGKSPLGSHEEFYKTTCPECGSEAIRETDVSDTFLDSAWYFLRYTSTDIENAAFDTEKVKKWLPVNVYIGGAEHSVLHLLYSRFVTSVLKDLNFIDFDEPYKKFFAHGLIIKDGAKMSKSKGNVVVPDEYLRKYGADTLRLYLMFLGPFSQGGDFRDSGIEGMNRFVRRVWTLLTKIEISESRIQNLGVSLELDRKMHQTIKDVTQDLRDFKYNTAIARLMEYYNVLSEHFAEHKTLDSKYCETFVLLLAPFAPHLTEELWHEMKQEASEDSVHFASWPQFDPKYLVEEEMVVVVQVNGKKRGEFKVESSKLKVEKEIETKAKSLIASHLEGKEIVKVVYVPGKILNFVLDKV